MPAIITNDIRVFNAQQFVESLGEAANSVIYTFIGQPSFATANAAIDNVTLQYDIWDNMIALKRVTASDIRHAIRKITWTQGNVYARYSQDDANLYTRNFYVINPNDNRVYKCLGNAGNGVPSTVAPTFAISQGNTTLHTDGYRWKYMYTVSPAELAKFGTPSFIPVIVDIDTSNAAINGSILHIDVVNPGSYTVAPSVVILGDGTGATATVNLNGTSIANVVMTNVGSGYRFANVILTGGTGSGGVLQASISPPGGHGANQLNELNASYVVLNSRIETTDTAFPSGITYHQIGLVQDPQLFGGTTPATASTLKAYSTIVLSGTYSSPLTQGNIITQTTGPNIGANAYLLNKEANNANLNIIRSRTVGANLALNYRAFQPANSISTLSGISLGTIGSVANPEVRPGSGEIIYVDNRAPITRVANQAESISIILEF